MEVVLEEYGVSMVLMLVGIAVLEGFHMIFQVM